MGENLTDFIFDVAMIAVFIAALSLFLLLNPASEKTVDLIESTINRDKDVMESREDVGEYTTVTGAEIIGNLVNGLETDIKIGSMNVDMENYKPYDFDYDKIDETGVYKVKRNIDPDGKVDLVIYELE